MSNSSFLNDSRSSFSPVKLKESAIANEETIEVLQRVNSE